MDSLKKVGRTTYRAYVAIGILAMAVLAAGVIFTVIMRYFFGISYAFVEEFLTLTFAFTTFWGLGMCILENENIIIDFFLLKLSPKVLRIFNIFNYLLVLVVNIMMVYYSISWIATAGKIVSNGMKVKYVYLYSVMPIGFALAAVCTVIKLVLLIKNVEFSLKPVSEEPDPLPGGEGLIDKEGTLL